MIDKLKYGWVLYLIVAAVLLSINRRELDFQSLNRLKFSAIYLVDGFKRDEVDLRKVRQAIAYYKTLDNLFPATAADDNALGYASYLTHDYHRASEYFEKAAALEPNHYQVFFNLGMSYYAQRLYNRAEAAFKQALGLLGPQGYFRQDMLSPYSLVETPQGMSGDHQGVEFNLALWHCRQMIILSAKADSKAISSGEQELKKQWDAQLLKGKLFYWIPLHQVNINGKMEYML